MKIEIKSRDLRVGNWVTANSPAMIVKEISEYGVELYMPQSEADNWSFDTDEIEPIPLTEDILLNSGFEYTTLTNDYWGGLLIPCGNDGAKIRIRKGDEGWFFTFNNESLYISVNYVHTLQNLYFALTGEELTINL